MCSLYLVEGDRSELVMRGNVGFANDAIGQVRLRVGEGITGEAVEYMRPISTDTAEQHASYKHFAELGEERFPVFLAVPIRGKSGPLGALVVQRRAPSFDDRDVELLSVLGRSHRRRHPPRRARRRGDGEAGEARRGRDPEGHADGAPGHGGARARGRRRPAPAADPPERARRAPQGTRHARRACGCSRAPFDVADKAIRGLAERARTIGLGRDAAFLGTYTEILEDGRFRERATELVASGVGLAQALSQVAREVARTAVSVTRDPYLEERARDIEDLCDALTMLADSDKRSALPSKALLVGDTLTVFDLLVSARSQPAGIALSERATGPRLLALLKLLNVPGRAGGPRALPVGVRR